jgi:hypothetical protein
LAKTTNADEDQEFCYNINTMGLNIDLGKVLQYIEQHFEPEDVFEKPRLATWAADHSPSEIFDYDILDEWATEHGYIMGSD